MGSLSKKLPELSPLSKLPTPSQITEFRENGHVLVPGVLSKEEVSIYGPIIRDATIKHNTETRPIEERDTYGKAFLQVMNLWEVDSCVRSFVLAKRFGSIAAKLLGVPNVRIYHDQALYKEPGGGPTPWHQDQYYWPLDTNNTITMWMPLVDVSEDLGIVTFASGSHFAGLVENIPISDESDAKLEAHIREKGYPIRRPGSMEAGDTTWHYGLTLHSAPGNRSEGKTREVMTIIFFADGAKVTPPKSVHQEADRQRWLCGIEPGSKAETELNPLVL